MLTLKCYLNGPSTKFGKRVLTPYLPSLLDFLDDHGPELPGANTDADEDKEPHEGVQNLELISPIKNYYKRDKA